jgi:hemerythrin-like domain-containing protein
MNQARAKLAKDHEELDALLRCLAEDADAPSASDLEATWAAFEGRLIGHLDAEERFLLPLIEASNPEEVNRIRADHARIRASVAQLGLAIELHTIRKPRIIELIDFLRAHAKHEDEALYQLAGDKASAAVEHSIVESLKAAVRSALRELSIDHRARP